MKKNPSTQEILELFRFYSSDELKKEQTQLTRTANQVFGVANGKLKALFESNELETLREAGVLLNSIKRRVEAAKEAKERAEKEAERLRQVNKAAASKRLDADIPGDGIPLTIFFLMLHKHKHLKRYTNARHDYEAINQFRPNVAPLIDQLRERFNGAVLSEKNGTSNCGNYSLPYGSVAAFFRDLYTIARESCFEGFGGTESSFSELFDQFLEKMKGAQDELAPEAKAFLEHMEISLFAIEAMKADKARSNAVDAPGVSNE